jgi:hypothetical protein
MIFIRNKFILFFAYLFLLTPYHYSLAEAPRSSDASKFDISGVKLGMTRAQAENALMKHYKVDRNAFKYSKGYKNIITNKKEIKSITLSVNKTYITIYLVPKVPYDKKNPMRVYHVEYKQTEWSPDNEKAIQRAAFEKYGLPSTGDANGTDWCKEPNTVNLGMGCMGGKSDVKGDAILKLSSSGLVLSSYAYKKVVDDVLMKSKSAKPSF